MSWQQAKQETLEEWRQIRKSIEQRDEVQLLTDIHAAGAMCLEARLESEPGRKCTRCRFFDQFGGCSEVNGQMSEMVVDHEWEKLGLLVDRFLADLERLEVEPG